MIVYLVIIRDTVRTIASDLLVAQLRVTKHSSTICCI